MTQEQHQEQHQELAHLRAEVDRLQAGKSKAISALAQCMGERDRLTKALRKILDSPTASRAILDYAESALKGAK